MKEPIFVNIRDDRNQGDMMCSAQRLFPEYACQPVYDFRKVPNGDEPIILGGGGLLHPGVDQWILETSKKRHVIPVGIGFNYHGMPPEDWPSFLRYCPLVGIRDNEIVEFMARFRITHFDHVRFRFCPCPTLGMPAWFDARKETKPARLLALQHLDHPIPEIDGATHRSNAYVGTETFRTLAERYSKHRYVVTNSFHGALWAAMCGCAVALYRPFSTRFVTPFSPAFVFPIVVSTDQSALNDAFIKWEENNMSNQFFEWADIALEEQKKFVTRVRAYLSFTGQ